MAAITQRSAAAAALGLLSVLIAYGPHTTASRAASLTFAPAATSAPASATYGRWLGLNGNSASNRYTHEPQGPVDEFARYGIAYDRSFEITAGRLPSETAADGHGGTLFLDKLRLDRRYGMIPVSTIEYRGYHANITSDRYFPREARTAAEEIEGKTTVVQYVAGFIRSAKAILDLVSRESPGMPVLFEAMNEPWYYTTPLFNGAQYAQVIAKLLPAAQAAGIPVTDIYVAAFGADAHLNAHQEAEVFSPGWIAAMYAAEPSLRGAVQGWYFHPYGPPAGTEAHDSRGIQSLPEVRKRMLSGENNIIVSEVGFCARREGGDCHDSGRAEVGTSAQAAARLTTMLDNALAYRQAGWLRALIVYGRGDGGWAMVDPTTKLPNAQGAALQAFAFAHEMDGTPAVPCGEASPFGFNPAPAPTIGAGFLEDPFGGVSNCGAA